MSEKNVKIVCLMTASVAPRGCPGAKFNPDERRRMYLDAFAFYLQKVVVSGIGRLIFAENTGADLDDFEKLIPEHHKNDVELLSVDPVLFQPEKGKGPNELHLMDVAAERSAFLQDSMTYFMKVTGRYSILNIGHFLKRIQQEGEVLLDCDIKDHHLYSSFHLKWTEHNSDIRRIGFQVGFYKREIFGRWSELGAAPGKTFENLILGLYHKYRGKPGFIFRSKSDLLINGLAGHSVHMLAVPIPRSGQKYICYCRAGIGTLIRRICPFFWF